jgi:hypothetical protein
MTILNTGRVIHEITTRKNKKKWLKSFLREYNGDRDKLENMFFGPGFRYFEISDGTERLGFIMIADKSTAYVDIYDGAVWSVSAAYVKPKHRSNGALRDMICHVVANCEVKLVYIEIDRFQKHSQYYLDLGFTHTVQQSDDEHVYISQTSFVPVMKARNGALLSKASAGVLKDISTVCSTHIGEAQGK